MSKKVYVCCKDCQSLKAEPVSFINTEWIEGERYSTYALPSDATIEEKEKMEKGNKIPHHKILTSSGCCNVNIDMCQHEECFTNAIIGLGMGTYGTQRQRVKGQAQLNPDGHCKYYKRKKLKVMKPRKAKSNDS